MATRRLGANLRWYRFWHRETGVLVWEPCDPEAQSARDEMARMIWRARSAGYTVRRSR